MAELLRWGSAGFLDKQPFWNRANTSSLALGALAALGLGASTYLGFNYLRYERLATADQMAATSAERANAELQDQMAKLRDRLATTERTLTAAQGRISNLSAESQRQQASAEQNATTKGDRITHLQRSLDEAQRDLHMAEAQRVTLLARLIKAESDYAESLQRQQQAQSGAEQWQKKIQQLTIDRDKANAERDQMRLKVEQLEQKQSARQAARSIAQAQQQTAPAAIQAPAVAAVTPAPVAAAPQVAVVPQPAIATPVTTATVADPTPALVAMAAPGPAAAAAAASVVAPAPVAVAAVATVPGRAARPAVAVVQSGRMAQFERVLASAGVDVAHLFAQFGVNRGEGGPFIPVGRSAAQTETLTPEKVAALARMVKALPVSAPLTSYDIGSPFGVRGDPINGHAAYHTGLDFRAPYESPVYATAAGVVTFSGYRNDYGKIVEIDHGNGITTRYGHLHRALVSVGQRVSGHMQIGYLGSTGRATGPHVHYEVLVNGEPQDPQKFMGLGHLVKVAQ